MLRCVRDPYSDQPADPVASAEAMREGSVAENVLVGEVDREAVAGDALVEDGEDRHQLAVVLVLLGPAHEQQVPHVVLCVDHLYP